MLRSAMEMKAICFGLSIWLPMYNLILQHVALEILGNVEALATENVYTIRFLPMYKILL